MNSEHPLESGPSRSPARRRLVSRVLTGLSILAVGSFGYLLGVRLNAPTGAQGGGPGGGFAGGGSGQGQQSGGAPGGSTGRTPGAGGAPFAAGGQGNARSGAPGTFGRSGGRTGGRSVVASVQVVMARTGVLSAEHQAAATVIPVTQSNVAAQTSGTVQQILQPVGATVRQGQAVIALVSDSLQAAEITARSALQQARLNLATQTNANLDQRGQLSLQVRSVQATLATAQQTYAADQRLYGVGAISMTELNAARAAVDTAQASLASASNALAANERARSETLAGLQLSVQQAQNTLTQAQQNAAYATVRAPFDGQISAVPLAPGESLNNGATAFTLVSAGRKVTFNVPPGDAAALKIGQVLPFKVNQQTYQVKLDQAPAAPVNSVVTVSARLLGSVPPSVGAVGTVDYSTPAASGVLLPSSALLADATQSYVFMSQRGQARRQNVTLLGQSGDQSAVSGLPAGSSVLTSPPSGLLDGARITVASGAQGTGQHGQGAGQQGSDQSGTAAGNTTGSPTPGSATGGHTRRSRRGPNGAAGQAGQGQGAQTAPGSTQPAGSQP